MSRRGTLSADVVVEAAVAVADEGGLGKVTMRNVAGRLGVEAMSLYHHVAGKEALLDALADWVFTRIVVPAPTTPWRQAMEERADSARATLAAHPWALGLIESRRSPGPALLRHHDAVLGCLRAGGLSVALAAHAFSVLDAYVHGFVLTEVHLPFADGESAEEFVATLDEVLADRPHMREMVAEQITGRDYRYGDEFAFGLTLILDGLERHLAAEQRAPGEEP